jgi:hypothetical protein
VNEGREQRVEEPDGRERDAERVDADGGCEIRPDDATGATGDGKSLGELQRVRQKFCVLSR